MLHEEKELGFPHRETCPAKFSEFHTRGLEKHPVTEMVLKSLLRSRGLYTLESVAHPSGGPCSVWKEVKLVLTRHFLQLGGWTGTSPKECPRVLVSLLLFTVRITLLFFDTRTFSGSGTQGWGESFWLCVGGQGKSVACFFFLTIVFPLCS